MRMLALTVLLMLSAPAWAQTPGTINAKLQDGSGTKITSTGGALDVNCPSCSSGGGLTDTQLRNSPVAVSGTLGVTGTFWQATQPISGSVSVSNFPASQAVTGTFFQVTQPVSIASMPSTPVTGVFFQSTQPVSAAALPLPSNAAQETGGNLATIATNTATIVSVIYQSTPLPRPQCNLVRRTQCAP